MKVDEGGDIYNNGVMENAKIIIGSRGSRLALVQSEWVLRQLEGVWPGMAVEIRVIQTKGDKILDSALHKIGDKGLFTREIEDALLAGQIDLAVHSLKDMPTQQPAGLMIGAVTAREDPADFLISRQGGGLAELPEKAVVLSGSLRRRAQIGHIRPDVVVRDVRGNVPTRIRKFEESKTDAMILAAAGIKRLGLDDVMERGQRLEPASFLPACGQGALALEIRKHDEKTADLIAPLNDPTSRIAIIAERTVLAGLEAGCQVPMGAYAECQKNGQLHLQAMVADLMGKRYIWHVMVGASHLDSARQIGENMAKYLLEHGGADILEQLKHES